MRRDGCNVRNIMIGPIQFAPGLYCGSRPQTAEDRAKLEGFVMIDLEQQPVNGMSDFWFPLQSIVPPLKFRVAAVLNALTVLATIGNRKAFLHCRTCRDRTPFVVAKYLTVVLGKSRREAFQFIEQFRPHWYLAFWRLFI